MGILFQLDYTKKIDDLYNSYIFAQNNKLTTSNTAQLHKLLAKNIVASSFQGNLRTQNMFIATDEGKIEYVAISPFKLKEEIDKFYSDLHILVRKKISIEGVFLCFIYSFSICKNSSVD